MAVFGGGRFWCVTFRCNASDFNEFRGIKATPGSPADAKGLLKSSIRDNNPVVFLQSQEEVVRVVKFQMVNI